MKSYFCGCSDWKENIHQLLMASFLQAHGIEYSGVLMRYCPWCGKSLEVMALEKVPEKQV